MMFSIKDFFSKRDQIRGFLRIWSCLLEKSLTLEAPTPQHAKYTQTIRRLTASELFRCV